MNQLLDEPITTQAAQTPEEETAPAPPVLWWIRDGIADAQLHQVDPKKPEKTLCKLSLYGRFRPASSAEVHARRRCPQCCPLPVRAARKGRR